MNIENHFDGNIYWTFSILKHSAILCQDNINVFCSLILFLINRSHEMALSQFQRDIFRKYEHSWMVSEKKISKISSNVKKYWILKTFNRRHWLNILNILATHFLWNIRQYYFIFCQDKAILTAKRSGWNYFKLSSPMR